MPHESTSERALFLSTEIAGRREFRLVAAALLISGIVFVAAAPFAKVPLGQVPSFIPMYSSVLVICDVITAVLLYGQFSLSRSRALLVLASGYLFTACITSAYSLLFPGMFAPTGLFGAGPQATSAMYMFWHGGFPLVVIGYSLLKETGSGNARGGDAAIAHPRFAILSSIAVVLAVVCAFTVFATAGHDYIPVFLENNRTSDLGRAVLTGDWLLSLLALGMLWRRKPHTVIDIWLMVVMWVWLFDIALAAILNSGRYDLGWYVGRIYGLLAASCLLVMLLIENGNYYARLVLVSAKLSEANRSLALQSAHIADDLRRYRGLLEAAPDATVVVNHRDEIVMLNFQTTKQFGYRHDELLGQKITSIIPDGLGRRLETDCARPFPEAPQQQTAADIELCGRREDGSLFPIEIMQSATESAEGTQVTVAIRDVTARKAAEKILALNVVELRRSNEELAQFANVASHDLQEPLRMVSNYMQLLSKRYNGKLGADADEFIAFALDGANRMQRLIRDLLAFSRIGSNGQQLIDTSSEDALEKALWNLRGAIEDSGALVTHDPLPMVQADARQLVQLFQNLVGNAIKYNDGGTPHVHVAAARDGKKWLFSVRDDGLGIDHQNFERIFGMFQRLHTKKAFPGTGIGLAICKKIVERHGGAISVESQLANGSTFRFALREGVGATS